MEDYVDDLLEIVETEFDDDSAYVDDYSDV